MRLRKLYPFLLAYVLVVGFVVGLMVDRRPDEGGAAAVPALGAPPRGAQDHTPVLEREARPAGGALWLQVFRPTPEMARALLEQAIPYLRATAGGAGAERLKLHGELAPPRGIFQVVFPFLAGRDSRLGPVASRGDSRAPPPPAPEPGAPAPDPGAPAHDSGAPAHDSGAPAHDSGAPAHDSGAPAPDPGAPAPGPGALASDPAPPAPGPAAAGGTGAASAGDAGCGRPPGVTAVAGGIPLVGIYHTHDYESYISEVPGLNPRTPEEWQRVATTDPARSVIRVGNALADALCKRGVTVVHSPSVNSLPMQYVGAYEMSYRTARYMLDKFPTIKVLLDIHRDAENPTRPDVTATIGGKPVARVLLVLGMGTPREPQPGARENLAWARKLDGALDARYPGLSRGLVQRPYWYNQQLLSGAVLLEVGSVRSHLAEALRSADLLADVLAELLRAGEYPP